MNREKMLHIFLTESDDLLVELEQGLMSLEMSHDDSEAIHQVFRAAHTLKGNASMVGFDAVVDFAHVIEGVLDGVRDQRLTINKKLISELLTAVDSLREMITAIANGTEVTLSQTYQHIWAELTKYTPQNVTPAPITETDQHEIAGPRVYEIIMRFREDLFETGQDPSLLILDLTEIGEVIIVEPDLSQVPRLENLEPTRCYLTWRVVLRSEAGLEAIKGVFIFVSSENDIVIKDVSSSYHGGVDVLAAEKKIGELLVEEGCLKEQDVLEVLKKQKRIGELLVESGKIEPQTLQKLVKKQESARQLRQKSSIRVDTEKLDRLVNLVGELVICVAQVNKKTRDPYITAEARISAVEALEQNSRELQEQVMSLRMVPVRETFDRFIRPVRDLANEMGKFVVLETSGTETELDKNVIEQLVDPLKHMIRNCVSHGIELPQERIAAGKSDTGRIHLKAMQREGHIIISVMDDGQGIDPDTVLQKARERGLVAEGRVFSPKEIYELLFQPGFSTAKEVNEVSGRGVGLDVVRKNVEALRGTIEVESEYGKGTTFRIKLPLTLAIIDGMNVKVGTETISIPLLSVVELIEPTTEVMKTVEGKGEIVDVRGEILPMIRLSEVFQFHGGRQDKRDAKVVIVENEGRKFGVLVDQVLGMEQAVIRPLDMSFELFKRLEGSYQRTEGIAGATILGDGTVGLIFDVNGIERLAFGVLH